MDSQNVYEINLLELLGKCLLHWKKIAVIAIIIAFAALGWTHLTFKAPAADCEEYREIEQAIVDRASALRALSTAEKEFAANQYHGMAPETLQTKRLTIAVELEDRSQITEQIGPTDLVLFAYHNMARTGFYREMVPAVVTDLQWNQLISIGYDSELNILSVSMTSDDETLIDTVLAAAAQYYTARQDEIINQTQSHSLRVLPVAVTVYDLITAEEKVSTAKAEENLQKLEEKVYTTSAALQKLLGISGENTVISMTEDEVAEKFAEKKQNDSDPGTVKPLVIGGILGGLLMLCWYCIPPIFKGRLLGESSVAQLTGWRFIGRMHGLNKTKDPIVKWGRSLLCRNHKADSAALQRDVAELAMLLLRDRSLAADAKIGLVGDLSDKEMSEVIACLAAGGLTVESAPLTIDHVAANKLCRQADAVIFVGQFGTVTTKEVRALQEILMSLDKIPLGYVLI